jgi:hypothetical protein
VLFPHLFLCLFELLDKVAGRVTNPRSGIQLQAYSESFVRFGPLATQIPVPLRSNTEYYYIIS